MSQREKERERDFVSFVIRDFPARRRPIESAGCVDRRPLLTYETRTVPTNACGNRYGLIYDSLSRDNTTRRLDALRQVATAPFLPCGSIENSGPREAVKASRGYRGRCETARKFRLRVIATRCVNDAEADRPSNDRMPLSPGAPPAARIETRGLAVHRPSIERERGGGGREIHNELIRIHLALRSK